MTSRYIPFTQQPYCCVGACLQMVMYRRGIPLLPQEDISYAFGLTVPAADAHLFKKVYTGPKPASGWGTRIEHPDFEINKALQALKIPLKVDFYKSDKLKS